MQWQWPVFFQQLAEIPTDTRRERWEVFVWSVGDSYAVHVAYMLPCAQASQLGRKNTQCGQPGWLHSPTQGLEQMLSLKEIPVLQGSNNGGTSKPNRLQQQTQSLNLQCLLACCTPIKRHLKKICQNYIRWSWALLDTQPYWWELNSIKSNPEHLKTFDFWHDVNPGDAHENNFHCLPKAWANAISTPAAFPPVSERIYMGIACSFFEHQTCIN